MYGLEKQLSLLMAISALIVILIVVIVAAVIVYKGLRWDTKRSPPLHTPVSEQSRDSGSLVTHNISNNTREALVNFIPVQQTSIGRGKLVISNINGPF